MIGCTSCCSQEAKNLAYLSLVRPHLEYAAAAWDPYMAKSSNSNVFNVVLPVLSKKIIAIQLLSLVCLIDELVWLPLFERRKHSRLTVFHKALNNLSAFSLDHLSVSSRHTIYSRASNENKFVSLPVRTASVFKYSFFPRTITGWNSLPLADRLLQSTQSFHGALQNSTSSNRWRMTPRR